MAITLINPDGVFKPETYAQVALATGTTTVYISGQVALNSLNHHVLYSYESFVVADTHEHTHVGERPGIRAH